MDPAGIREILLLRPYLDNPYQIELVRQALPYKTRVHRICSISPWFPFSEPLTQRVSRHSEGYTGWLQYDCAVLAGVDLQSATERDIQNLRSALARGLPVLLAGGGFGLGGSYRLWHDLDPYLPARIPPVGPVGAGQPVTAAGPHPILRGLPAEFGVADQVHPLELQEGAAVVLRAGDRPVLVASERAGSRQLILAVAAAGGLCCDALDDRGFYGHPWYPDLMRRCLSWLMGVDTPLWIETLALGPAGAGAPHRRLLAVGVCQPQPVAGAVLRCRLHAVDEARLAAGGDTRRTELLAEEERAVGGAAATETFALGDLRAGRCSGVYEVEVSLEMPEPPRQVPKDCFAMAQPPSWNNWKGKAVDARRFWVRFPDRRAARVRVAARGCTLEPGRALRLGIEAPDLRTASLEIRDITGATVGVARAAGKPQVELVWTPPALAEGMYEARVTVERGGGAVEGFALALHAVALPPADADFHLVGHSSSGTLSDDELAELHRATLVEFGLDTLSHGNLNHAAVLLDEARDWAAEPFGVRRRRWVEGMIAGAGRYLWDDFDAPLVLLATHGATKEYAPTTPCVHDPGYEAAVRRLLEPRLRLLAQQPGHISTEIIDEPHLHAANLCRCEICQRLYRERYSEELPAFAAVAGDQTARRWHLFEWLTDYTERAFAVAYRLKEELAPGAHVHNTAIDRLFTSTFMFHAMPRWAAHGDELYMACYPFSYANWRGRHEMPHCQTHWIAAWVRGLARHHGKSWGVFMELWEHDTPNRWLTPYWSVAQFYALLAEGADRLDTFLVSFGNEFFGISWDRLREFGREVNKVRPFFPLLARSRRPRARLAFLNPWAEWVLNPLPHYLPPDHEGYGYYRRYGLPFDKLYPNENRRMLVFELFHRVFGEVDTVDEMLLADTALDHQAVAVCDCRFLMRRSAERLAEFVRGGGLLVLDRLPDRDEHGQPLAVVSDLAAAPASQEGMVVPGLAYRVFAAGRGHVLWFSRSLQEAYADAVEGGRPGIQAALEATVGRLLAELGARSRIFSSNGAVDAGLRLARGAALVPVANTADTPQTASITVRELPFAPVWAVNLTDGAELALGRQADGVAFAVELGSYRGALCALFPAKPTALGVRLEADTVSRGADLKLAVSLTAGGNAAAGTLVIHLAVTGSDGQVQRRLSEPVVVEGGRLEIARTVPVNAAPGRWRIVATEPVTGLEAAAEFVVQG